MGSDLGGRWKKVVGTNSLLKGLSETLGRRNLGLEHGDLCRAFQTNPRDWQASRGLLHFCDVKVVVAVACMLLRVCHFERPQQPLGRSEESACFWMLQVLQSKTLTRLLQDSSQLEGGISLSRFFLSGVVSCRLKRLGATCVEKFMPWIQ